MGEFDISGDLESKRAITKNVKRVIVHRQYDPATFENDIALLELDSAVQFDTHVGKWNEFIRKLMVTRLIISSFQFKCPSACLPMWLISRVAWPP